VTRILFVCMGNICRSPLAEGIARARARERGLALDFDSAGTHAYHVGEPPDPRARALARARGTPIDALRARQVRREDFDDFDLILAADRVNLDRLRTWGPREGGARCALLLDWAGVGGEVPDPYYGDERDFERVYDLLDGAIDALLQRAAPA
jgi:protein-tyrosine phosphatase